MVKRTITITTILLILSIAISLIIVLNKSSFAADGDIASGTSGTCSWVIDSEGVLTISPTDGVSGTLEYINVVGVPAWDNYRTQITKVVVEQGVKANAGSSRLFWYCSNCTEMDLSGLDTSDVTAMNSMFYNCSKITSIDVTGFDTSNVSTFSGMFSGCTTLVSLDVSGFNTSKATEMARMFQNCSRLTKLDVSKFDTSNVTALTGMFENCSSLTELDVSNFNTSNVINLGGVFYKCKNLTYLDVSNWDTEKVEYMGNYRNGSHNYGGTFDGCSNLTNLDVSNWDTKNVIEMACVFRDCSKLTNIDVSKWDVSSAINMSKMFYGCSSLNSVDVSKWTTDSVDTFEGIFRNCSNITELDVSNWNTSNATDIGDMFANCLKLESIDVSNFDTAKVTIMSGTFYKCSKLTNIDLSNWNTVKVTSMANDTNYNRAFAGMFEGCLSITELDLSSFNTNNVENMRNMFYNCPKLKKIKLGQNFSFLGKKDISENKWAILPTPNGIEYTGKWIREDKNVEPYTPIELRDNYDGNTMAGTWIWEKIRYNVSYSYSGAIPYGVSDLPETIAYEAGDIVTVTQNAMAPGYIFSGWSRTGTFEMPAEDVEITGSFTANTDTPYKVENYLENLTEGEYTLVKTDNLTGTTDTEATATAKDYEGFTFDSSITGTILSGNIAGDGSLVLKVYYKRNSYNVTYAYTGDVPDDATALPQGQNYKYGAEINVPENATAEGYTFSGWIKDYITMPAQDIEITGYFIENTKSYNYKVEYYFDGELDDSLEEILNAEKDEEINLTPQTPVKHGEKNYTLISNNHNITISINEEENVINVYYETDVLDYEIDNSEDTIEGDGIPDKYQIEITYKVENGSWDDGTKGTKTDVITLKDKNGNYAEDGTGELNVPQVGNKPAEGYTTGSWNNELPNMVSKDNYGDEYIYSYKKNEISKANISETDGKASNPKTDDIMHNYLLVGIGGVLVLMIVRKIRRKYSRKAKKVQF